MATGRRARAWRGWAALAAVLGLAPATGAGAAPLDDRGWLLWHASAGADGCVGSASFEADVDRRLGESGADVARRAGIRLSVDLQSAPGTTATAEMTFAAADGRAIGRRAFDLRGVSCGAAGEALSIAAALFLQDFLRDFPHDRSQVAPTAGQPETTRLTENGAPGAATTEAAPAPVVVAARPPSTPPRADVRAQAAPPLADRPPARPSRWTFGGTGGAIIGVGDVPSGSFGVEATLLARPTGGPTLFLAGDFWPRQQTSSDVDVALSLQIFAGRAGLCPLERRWTSRALSLCAAFELGRLSATGNGVDTAAGQERWKVAADVGVALTQDLSGPWSARLEARLVVPFERDRVTIVDSNGQAFDLFRASPVGGAAVISVGYAAF